MSRFPCCILATCVVPWNEEGAFDSALFVDQVRALLGLTPYLYIFGTAGEGYAVNDEQFAEITRVFHAAMIAGGGEPMVGVISLSLPTIVRRIELARELGLRRFQISLPCWGALNDAEVEAFFAHTCGRFPDCEFLHYNLLRTKRLLTPEEHARLATLHPNLVATKNSTDAIGRLTGLMRTAPELRHFFTETGFAYASQLGECGLLASVSTINHLRCRELFEAARTGDATKLTSLDEGLRAVHAALMAAVGTGPHMDGAFDKLLWRMHDPRFPLRLLPPYQGADEAAVDRFTAEVRRRAPEWLPART